MGLLAPELPVGLLSAPRGEKLLIHSDRPPAKKAQDVLYIHDTLELSGGSVVPVSTG